MSIANVAAQYDRVAGLYDIFFSVILDPGRRKAIERINALPPSRILEVGVGTGLSLDKYHPKHHIIGIDISAKMIQKAERRKRRLALSNVALMRMDAEALHFADNSFDVIVAMYVVSTVGNPQQLMAEIRRVCRPYGKIYILNHFSYGSAALEKYLLPLTSRLGWKSYFERAQIDFPSFRLVNATRTNLFGYWQLLEYARIR